MARRNHLRSVRTSSPETPPSPAPSPVLVASDGAQARLVEGRLEVLDREGRLLVRSVEGGVEVGPAQGDLRLRAPGGRVEIEAGLDVCVRAQRDVLMTADRSVETRVGGEDADLASRVRVEQRGTTIVGSSVDVRARRWRLVAGISEVVARELKTSATRVETTATDIDTTAERVVVRAKNVVEEVAELLESKVGRVRTLVRGVFSLRSRTTSLKSKDDTAIDGRRVLLG